MTKAYNVPRHHVNLLREQSQQDPIPQDPGFSAEVFHRLYSESPNALPAGPGNAVRHKMHDLISELPEFDVLRHLTTRDPMWSALASTSLGGKVAPFVPKSSNVQSAENVLAGLEMMAEENPDNAKIDAALKQAHEALDAAIADDATNAGTIDESAVRVALRAAIGQATQEIQDADQALTLLGYGSTSGAHIAGNNPTVALELARRVKASPSLSAIIALAGKLTRTARAKRASRSEYARSEVVGVEQTNAVERLLGSEMALLNDPDMSDDLMMRLLENKALGYKMSGKEKLSKGPIVLMLDQSGSMGENNKDVWAKAIALAIYDAARQDKRDFAVVLYTSTVRAAKVVKSPTEMLDLLSNYVDGGTDYAPAMAQSLALASTKSDIIHITDGSAPTHDAAAMLAKASAMNTHVFGIMVGREHPAALRAWSHEVTQITDVTKDTQAMDLIFGEGGI